MANKYWMHKFEVTVVGLQQVLNIPSAEDVTNMLYDGLIAGGNLGAVKAERILVVNDMSVSNVMHSLDGNKQFVKLSLQ